jgi:hypothetical protein
MRCAILVSNSGICPITLKDTNIYREGLRLRAIAVEAFPTLVGILD